MDERLRALDVYLARLSRAVNQGPIAGAYFPLTMRIHMDGAALAVGDESPHIPLNFQVSPHYLAAITRPPGAHVTIQLTDGSIDLLVNPIDTSVEPVLNVRSGFDPAYISEQRLLRIRVDSIVAGTPTEVSALLVCAHVQKVDDPQV